MMSLFNERRFLIIEQVCYALTLAGLMFLAVRRLVVGGGSFAYTMPLLFTMISLSGLVFMFRFFIYEDPENVMNRKIAQRIKLNNHTKGMLLVGHAACLTMLILGVVGLWSPAKMESLVSKLSPISWLIE